MPDTIPTPRSRPIPPKSGDEQATYHLRLGEFEETPCLSVAECNTLLESIRSRGARQPVNSEVYNSTVEYVRTFSRFKDHKTVTQVDVLLDEWVKRGVLVPFEKAQIASLCCDTAEEAKTLIPSLESKIDDDELQGLLNDIIKLRDFS
ncbi:hypothetical protein K470DRAFT_63617 [Piedraia hortae CBS 480.64]|uniref:RNA polymerase Rpb4/RPC9 core domain-containing protein n=1 Tax=Piedraia hortae CBS 480.64 TaxID=1314780 RepID=A0A6A7BZU0_9PEZI|nr:hypothetical protein K470DRAFT_63617 [Piedraia hortae CBS 480.64]